MTSAIFESEYFGNTFANPKMVHIFSDTGRFACWLEVEAALARAQEKLGLIPEGVGDLITRAAKVERLDIKKMTEEYEKVGFPILPLIHEVARNSDDETLKWLHWGATTQDIIDTGMVLQMRQAFDIIEDQLGRLIMKVVDLTNAHRNTVMVGRTFQQHASPITFGFKTAIWLNELLRHQERLSEIKKRIMVCQFGGAVGTLATLGNHGSSVVDALSSELNLASPSISWHTSRDGWAEACFWLSLVGATLAKIANEVAILMRSEIDEVREPFETGRGGSSTMPQKRNPIACPIIIAIGTRIKVCIDTQLAAMVQEHERGVSSMPMEWLALPEAFILVSGSLRQSIQMLGGLEVNEAKMQENLNSSGGMLMAEAVMMGIAKLVGRQRAHNMVSKVSSKAFDEGKTLKQAIIEDEELCSLFSSSELDILLDPSNYLGSAQDMISAVLRKAGYNG